MRAVFVGLIFIAAPASAADQFDLVCMFGKTEVRYRVDLSSQEACENECDRIWKMGASTAGEIRVMDTIVNAPDELPQTIVVNRQTGKLVHWIGARVGGEITETATCEPAPFTGFPAAKF